MSNNAAPDSWEENELTESQIAADLQQKLIKLNVNAVEFVPSFTSFSSKSDDVDGGPEDETAGGGDKKTTSKWYRF